MSTAPGALPDSRAVLLLSAGTALAQLVAVVTLPILARLYSPESIGSLGAITAVVAVLSSIASLRVEFGIVTASTDAEATELLSASFSFLLLSVVVVAGLSLLVTQLAGRQEVMGIGLFGVYSISALLLLTQAPLILRMWFLRTGDLRGLARTSLEQACLRSVVPVAFGVLSGSLLALVLSDALARLLGLFLALRTRGIPMRYPWRWPSVGMLRGTLRSQQTHVRFGVPSALLNAVALHAPIPLMLGAFGSGAAGQFAMAHRILQAPLALLGRSTADVLHSAFAGAVRTGTDAQRAVFLRTFLGLAAFGFVPLCACLLWSDEIFAAILGDSWREAGRVAQALSPWAYAAFVVSPLSRVAQVVDGQRQKLAYDVVAVALVFGVFRVRSSTGMSFVQTAWFLSAAECVAYAVYLGVLWRLVGSRRVRN